MRQSSHETDDLNGGWGISLAFWCCLLVAASLYGLVALAPKLLTYLDLQSEYVSNQYRLVTLEQQVRYLDRVVHALEHDPDFAAQLARIDFDAVRPDEERIPVDESLRLDALPDEQPTPDTVPAAPWYQHSVEVLATHRRTRAGLMIAAALLVLCSFTFLSESPRSDSESEEQDTEDDHAPRSPRLLSRLLSRYVSSSEQS